MHAEELPRQPRIADGQPGLAQLSWTPAEAVGGEPHRRSGCFLRARLLPERRLAWRIAVRELRLAAFRCSLAGCASDEVTHAE